MNLASPLPSTPPNPPSTPSTPHPATGGVALGRHLCRPFDASDLFRRLRTFRTRWWFGKPPNLSPHACAIRGWTNVGPDALRCESCHATLDATTVGSRTDSHTSLLVSRLETAHDTICAWRKRACAETLAALPVATAQETQRQVEMRRQTIAHARSQPSLGFPTPIITHEILNGEDVEPWRDALTTWIRDGPTVESGSGISGRTGGGRSSPRGLEWDRPGDTALEFHQLCTHPQVADRILALFGWEVFTASTSTWGNPHPPTATTSSISPITPSPMHSTSTPSTISHAMPALGCSYCGALVSLRRPTSSRMTTLSLTSPGLPTPTQTPTRAFAPPVTLPANITVAPHSQPAPPTLSSLSLTIAGGSRTASATEGPFGRPSTSAFASSYVPDLDVIGHHRHFCPYVCGVGGVRAMNSIPGWQAVVRAVLGLPPPPTVSVVRKGAVVPDVMTTRPDKSTRGFKRTRDERDGVTNMGATEMETDGRRSTRTRPRLG